MTRTIRRQPLEVSIPKDTSGFFTLAQYKGLCDNRNDVTIDQSTFAAIRNLFVDDNDILTSRPPLVRTDSDSYIIYDWYFTPYGFRLYKQFMKRVDGKRVNLTTLAGEDLSQVMIVYTLECITHETKPDNTTNTMQQCIWEQPYDEADFDELPKVLATQIEDKIYFWFAGVDFVCFNIVTMYFESAIKYIYIPVHTLVTNGVESELETKNYLTNTYRKRHIYSTISSVNFDHMSGREVSVNLRSDQTQNASKHLYETLLSGNSALMLVYPYSPLGNNFIVDVVETARAMVILRYSSTLNAIDVSFDGKSYRSLPRLDNILGAPCLTKDGLWAVAFTANGLAKCKLVAQDSEDFVDDSEVLVWQTDKYLRYAYNMFNAIELDSLAPYFVPQGHFETIDNFAYIVGGRLDDSSQPFVHYYLYSEWLNGANETMSAIHDFTFYGKDSGGASILYMGFDSDDYKVHFKYVPPTQQFPNVGPVISLLTPRYQWPTQNDEGVTVASTANDTLTAFFVTKDQGAKAPVLHSNDCIALYRNNEPSRAILFVFKLESGKYPSTDGVINDGDIVLITTSIPNPGDSRWNYISTKTYYRNEYCVYNDKVYYCRVDGTKGITPGSNSSVWVVNGGYGSTMDFDYTNGSSNYTGKCSSLAYWMYGNGDGYRYVIHNNANDGKPIKPNEYVTLTHHDEPVVYDTANEFTAYFGPMTKATNDPNDTTWQTFTNAAGQFVVPANTHPMYYSGTMSIKFADYGGYIEGQYRFALNNFTIEPADTYTRSFKIPCDQMDISVSTPVLTEDGELYHFTVGYATKAVSSTRNIEYDCIANFDFDKKKPEVTNPDSWLTTIKPMSRWFKVLQNGSKVLTDAYLYVDGNLVELPQNGELYPFVDDVERNLNNDDNLVILTDPEDIKSVNTEGNIHTVTEDGLLLSSKAIQSGSFVTCLAYAETESEYLGPRKDGSLNYHHRYYIEKLVNDEGTLKVATGNIVNGSVVRLRGYNSTIVLPVGNPGNNTASPITMIPERYPSPPSDWSVGMDWPATWVMFPKPMFATIDGWRWWQAGDPLPSGPIVYYGYMTMRKRVKPLCIGESGVWYNIDGTLWTSQLQDDVILELDEYINSTLTYKYNASGDVIAKIRTIETNFTVPDHYAMLDQHFLSYVNPKDGRFLLEVSETRRDDDRIFDDEGRDLLLYLPKVNEQQFAHKITNLHPISESAMGVFTEDEIFYVSPVNLNNDKIAYTAPVKSKIPVGCRDGSDVVTALDGQVILFTSPKGVVAMTPQDFVATTERTLQYLSDNIQNEYTHFYNDIEPAARLLSITGTEFDGYDAMIKIVPYKYWIIFYRYMWNDMLAYDTRTATWWKWSTPYPVRSVSVRNRLYIIQQIDFNPIEANEAMFPPSTLPLMGVEFLWADREIENTDMAYADEVIDKAMDGKVYKASDDRWVVKYAEPIIRWSMTSQKLHFNYINNYKVIKQVNMSARGKDTMTCSFDTKVYRDFYHPDSHDVVEIKINDLRTFIQRVNLMHVIYFQYTLANDVNKETQYQLKLNSLSVKYEIKERVR